MAGVHSCHSPVISDSEIPGTWHSRNLPRLRNLPTGRCHETRVLLDKPQTSTLGPKREEVCTRTVFEDPRSRSARTSHASPSEPVDAFRKSKMSASKSVIAKKLMVFGGTGFVGSAIVQEAVRRGLLVTCVTRTGTPPSHIASQAWSGEVSWLPGDALRPETYRDAMRGADAVVTSVGRLPLPSLTHEEVVRDNGETNIVPGKTAKELGVERLVVVGASIPSFVPGMAWGVSAGKGVFTAGYSKGKRMAFDYARDEFVGSGGSGSTNKHGAVVLQPGGVSGTRHANGVAMPLWIAMSPLSRMLNAFPIDAVANLAPTPVENVARAAVDAATNEAYAGKFTVIDNLKLLREFDK